MKIRKMKRVTDWRQVRPHDTVVIVHINKFRREHERLLPGKSVIRNGMVYMPFVIHSPYITIKRQIKESRQQIIDRIKSNLPFGGIDPKSEFIMVLPTDRGTYHFISYPTMDDVIRNNMVFRWHKDVHVEFDERLLDIYLDENKEVFDMFDVTVGDLSTNN